MKEKSQKFTRYTTAAAALLAVSGGATAAIIPGTITSTGSDNALRNEGDEVYIDIDNDGINDFVGIVESSAGPGSLKRFLFGSEDNSFARVERESSSPYLKKFFLNDEIGPLAYSDSYGMISAYSSGDFPPPHAPGAPFDPQNDNGYIGVSIGDDEEVQYGWVQVQINEEGDEVSFLACALEQTPEQPILAGIGAAVPLLPIASVAGLGLIGLFAAMKRRKKLTA